MITDDNPHHHDHNAGPHIIIWQPWSQYEKQVCPIQDDEDGHLSYKLGDIIENETQRCKFMVGDGFPYDDHVK